MKKRLAIVTSHPVQYNAPLFERLSRSERIDLKVFYTYSQGKQEIFDRDFGRQIKWDIPLLENYPFEFVENTASSPGLHHFRGIVNPALVEKITAWSPDVILVYGWNYLSHLKVMRHFRGRVPVYFRGDSTLLDEQKGIRTSLRRAFLRWVYRHVDGAFYVGTNNKNYFLAHGLGENELFFAPHAIDIARFAALPDTLDKAVAWRKELGIGGEETVVLFAGKFEPKKDPAALLKAFMQQDKPGIRLLMVGNGLLEEGLRKVAEGDDRVIFLPFQNQSLMPAVYALSDLFVLPSAGPGETWGLAVNEAMAAGKAILASHKAGCSADLVRHGYNGYVFWAGDLPELSITLGQMLSSRDELKRMGENSREIIRAWSYDEVCKSIADQITRM